MADLNSQSESSFSVGGVVKEIVYDFFYVPFTVDAYLYQFIVGSFLICNLLYLATHWYLSKHSKSYLGLSLVDQKEMQSRVASTLHSVIVFPICFCVVVFDLEFFNNPVRGSNDWCLIAMAIGVGYFLSDSILILKYNIPPIVPIMAHHIFAGWGFLGAIGSIGQSRWFPTYMLLTEATTPFNNTHWMMGKLGLSETRTYRVISLTFATTWLIFRVLINPLLIWRLYLFWEHLAEMRHYNKMALSVNISFLLLLNNIYFITGPFLEIFRGKSKSKQS